MAEHLVEVENLKMYFKKVTGIVKRKTAYIKAVDNISFTIDKGETFGLVGESGCGKTTTGRTIIRRRGAQRQRQDNVYQAPLPPLRPHRRHHPL